MSPAPHSHRLSEFPPSRDAALARIQAVRPQDYASTRNHLDGDVSGLSPYITHGLVSLPEVLAGVERQGLLKVGHQWVFELGWREYFQHVWHHRGDGIFRSIHPGLLPDEAYALQLPADIREAATGIPVIDRAVHTLYRTGYLHNHARMWLASYVVHVRKVHWRVGADWLYGHLIDGDLASNHLSWQWVAATGSRKPYLFNAENVARYAPPPWHSPGSAIDRTYEELDQCARTPGTATPAPPREPTPPIEPPFSAWPPPVTADDMPGPQDIAGRDVWLVHPWNLDDRVASLPPETLVLGIGLSDFHRQWPWSERRWQFVTQRMRLLCAQLWVGDAATLAQGLQGARSVRTTHNLHLAPWLGHWVECEPAPALFPVVDRPCDSFSQWWSRVTHRVEWASEWLKSPAVAASPRPGA